MSMTAYRLFCVIAEERNMSRAAQQLHITPSAATHAMNALERSREYNGRYHVLHGVISPMNHVGPDDLHIKELLERANEYWEIKNN